MDRFEDAKLRIKEATDLVALIESYLPLKPRGRLLQALCPFHAEKSPSFTVYADSQHFRCYGCGKSGDVFTFLMEREGLSFREAMESLADRAKISLEGVFGRGGDRVQRGPDPHQALGEVKAFLQQCLHGAGGAATRSYLEERGLLAAAEPFGLGFHPAGGALLRFAQERRLPSAILEQAGLLRNGREPFAGRLMFPIEDERGRVCGFGGRVLPGAPPRADGTAPPKYINSPESPFFNKRKVLYGLWHAKQQGSRRILVMEGYTDVIACHLSGFAGAVAALGTAFTREHSEKLERYAQEGVVLLFDGDRAGQQAAERAMRELVNSRVPVKIAVMAGAKDPGDYVVARPGEDPDLVTERRARFSDLLDGAEDALRTWFVLLRRRLDFAQPADLERAVRECGQLLAVVDGDLRRRALLQEMARHLAMPAEELGRMLRRRLQQERPPTQGEGSRRAESGRPQPASAGNEPITGMEGESYELDPGLPVGLAGGAAPRRPLAKPLLDAERDLLAVLIERPELVHRLGDETFQATEVQALVEFFRAALSQGRSDRAEVARYVFAAVAEQQQLRDALAAAMARADEIRDPEAFFETLRRDRDRRLAMTSARTLRQQLQAALDAGDRLTADRLTKELVDQMRQHKPRPPVS